MEESVMPQIRELLATYRIYFKRMKIGSNTTASVQRNHLKAADIYVHVLNYYTDAVDKGWTERINITENEADLLYFKLIRTIKDANQVYYG